MIERISSNLSLGKKAALTALSLASAFMMSCTRPNPIRELIVNNPECIAQDAYSELARLVWGESHFIPKVAIPGSQAAVEMHRLMMAHQARLQSLGQQLSLEDYPERLIARRIATEYEYLASSNEFDAEIELMRTGPEHSTILSQELTRMVNCYNTTALTLRLSVYSG